MLHRPDPDEIASTSVAAIAYAERVEAMGRSAPPPALQVTYGPDRAQRLDIYAPPGARDLPILLFFHGGAWISGHLGWLSFMAPIVNALPAIFVAGTYRLAPRCRWPAAYDDVRDALRYVGDNARGFGGDRARIAIGGHSAGGHLASLLALKDKSASLLACLPISSSFDLQYGDVPPESEAGRVYRYLFADRRQDADASPINFVRPDAPPFHITWGERDFDRVGRSGAAMVGLLQHLGATVSRRIVAGASHFDTHTALSDPEAPWYDDLRTALSIPETTGRHP